MMESMMAKCIAHPLASAYDRQGIQGRGDGGLRQYDRWGYDDQWSDVVLYDGDGSHGGWGRHNHGFGRGGGYWREPSARGRQKEQGKGNAGWEGGRMYEGWGRGFAPMGGHLGGWHEGVHRRQDN